MGFLSANWLWIVLIGAMLLMHLRHGRMHGGHHGGEAHRDIAAGRDHGAANTAEAGNSEMGHHHGGS